MEHIRMEPADTIRAELARRRMTVGRLAAATGISLNTLQRRLSGGDFRLSELHAIATVLGIALTDLTDPYIEAVAG